MTRLRFLLVSFFGAVAAVFGFDRERMARAWLKANGFLVDEGSRKCVGGITRYSVAIYNPSIGAAGGRYMTANEPIGRIAVLEYIKRMEHENFTVTEKHETAYFYSVFPPLVRTVEEKPPTLHRFPRPWWV